MRLSCPQKEKDGEKLDQFQLPFNVTTDERTTGWKGLRRRRKIGRKIRRIKKGEDGVSAIR